MQATARAHSNIALIKYWGKRDRHLNLPAVGSISMTLNALSTETTVHFSSEYSKDTLTLDGHQVPAKVQTRTSQFLDLIRDVAGTALNAHIKSSNNFPTSAGLASSASGFAALTVAAISALDVRLSQAELSRLARQGSGSAARSIFGGFVEMEKGVQEDGSDSQAHQIYPPEYLDVRLLIAITSESEKKTGSTDGMIQTERTSPYYRSWIETSDEDIQAMKTALAAKDFTRIGELSEYSCLKMHASALAAQPGILYWNPGTVTVMQSIRELRASGTEVYFTIDAGPQVKVLCRPADTLPVQEKLQSLEEVQRVIVASPGPGAHLVSESTT